MKRPLVGIAILFAAGIVAGAGEWGRTEWWWWSAAGLLAAFLFAGQRRAALFAFVFVAGGVAYRGATSTSAPEHVVHWLGATRSRAELRGVVVSDPTGRKSFLLDVQAVRTGEHWQPACGAVYVSLREPRPVSYGDVVEFSASVRAPPPVRNPGGFDLRAWLARQRVYRVATVWPRDRWAVVATGAGNRLVALGLRLRTRLEAALHTGLEEEPGLAGVLAGMVIGERAEIPPDVSAAFQRTGMTHVFAVSGWNVALVTLVVVTALRVARVPRRVCPFVAIPLLVAYVLATGMRPSATRALVMACIWLLGWVAVRPVDLLNNVGGGALAILAWDPLQLFDGGFVLSFLAVVALVVLSPPIEQRLRPLVTRDPFVPEVLLSAGYRPWHARGLTLVQWLSASVAAWVGLLPVLPVYFNLFTPISILGNVLAVPILMVITAWGMLALLAHPVWPWLAETFNNANYALLHVLITGVEWLAEIPRGHAHVRAPAPWQIGAYYGVLLAALRWRRVVYALPVMGAALFVGWPGDRTTEVTIFDLNRGGAIFINAPGERNDVLVDGSDDWGGAKVVLPYLRSAGVDRLAAAILTRGDKNHAAGLRAIMAEVPVQAAGHAGVWTRSEFYAGWLQDVAARQVPLQKLRTGTDWQGCRVFHPAAAGGSGRSEDYVVVLGYEAGGTRFVFLGDASAEVLAEIQGAVAAYRPQIIVKGAEGAHWEETRDFLEVVRPELAIICRPQPGAFRMRREMPDSPVPLLRTDDTGAVTVRLTDRGYEVKTMLAGGNE